MRKRERSREAATANTVTRLWLPEGSRGSLGRRGEGEGEEEGDGAEDAEDGESVLGDDAELLGLHLVDEQAPHLDHEDVRLVVQHLHRPVNSSPLLSTWLGRQRMAGMQARFWFWEGRGGSMGRSASGRGRGVVVVSENHDVIGAKPRGQEIGGVSGGYLRLCPLSKRSGRGSFNESSPTEDSSPQQ